MTIEVELPDGTILEAPDGADPSAVAKAYLAKQQAPSRLENNTLAGLVGSVSRGATFGFGDEITAAGDAVLMKATGDQRPFGDIYRTQQQFRDREVDQFASEHPFIGGTAEGVGGLIPVVRAAKTAQIVGDKAPGVVRRIGRAAGLGGSMGGLAGYGNADPGERAEGAGIGAAVGAGIGTGGAGLVEGLSPIAQKLREPTRKILSYVEEMVAGRSAPAARIEPTISAAPVPPAVPATATTAPSKILPAQSKILQAMERDKTTPAAVADRLKAQQQLGKPVGIVDVAGENTRGLGRATVTLPGPGRQTAVEALNTRADGQRSRVLQDAESGLGMPAQDTDELSRQIIERRKAAAQPAYRKAYEQGEITDPRVIELLDERESYAAAHAKARRLLNDTDKDVPELFNPENNQLIRYPTVEDVDLIKKGLDRRLYNNGRGANDQDEPALDKLASSILERRRTALLDSVDAVAPDYKAARAGFAGETSMMEALEAGQDLFNADPRQVTRTLSEMTEGQREMFRTGALDAIRKRILSAADNAERANVVKSIFGYGKGGRAELVSTLFKSPDEFARFEAQMRSEIDMQQTRQHVMGGSQTANKMADAEDAALPSEVAAQAVLDVAGNGMRSGAMRVGRALVDSTVGRWKSGITEGTRSKVADELFNFSEADRAQDFLKQLERIRLDREAAMRTKSQVSSAGAMLGGANIP